MKTTVTKQTVDYQINISILDLYAYTELKKTYRNLIMSKIY